MSTCLRSTIIQYKKLNKFIVTGQSPGYNHIRQFAQRVTAFSSKISKTKARKKPMQ